MGAFLGKGFFNEPHRDTMAVSGLTGATVGLMSMASSQVSNAVGAGVDKYTYF